MTDDIKPLLKSKGRIIYATRDDAQRAVDRFWQLPKHLNGRTVEVWFITEDGKYRLLTVLVNEVSNDL